MKISRGSFGRGALGAVSAGVAPRLAAATEGPEPRISSLEGFGFPPLFVALGQHLFATRMARTGLIRRTPADWRDFHFPFPQDRARS